ncbi:MAG: hypothetical protein ACOX9C_06475 [Kiritimatiellia bacterium]|jgi:hypothetical protein
MNLLPRPEIDPVWPALTTAQRREAGQWIDILRRFEAAPDKGAELALILRDHAGLKGLSKSTLYRKRAAFRREGVAGLVHGAVARRLADAGAGLPREFIEFWHGLCGLNQRRKAAPAWRALFREHLCAGRVVPGYGTDWRGIWEAENPGREIPPACPYYAGGPHPRGWSYRNLLALAPGADVWAGAALGAQAMRSRLPSIPHTRVGLPFASLFVIDDVWHDVRVTFVDQAQAERPLELGLMEALTGRYASWGLAPTRRREDGGREMLKESYVRHLLCDLLCRVGVHPGGVTVLAEHGTAAIRAPLVERINREIWRLVGKDGFLRVDASGVYGKPLLEGLYAERPRGNPRFKAMLESSWNLLHNELAALPGQTGKDRDNAPADAAGRDKELRDLLPVARALAAECGAEMESLFRFGFLGFHQFERILAKAKTLIENRVDHRLEGWEECGFVRHCATIGGVEVDLEAQLADNPGAEAELRELIRIARAPVRTRRMSPLAAWRKCAAETELLRFPLSLAAAILGEECGRRVRVSDRGTITIPDPLLGPRRSCTFNAIVTSETGQVLAIPRGAEVVAALNPFDNCTLVVSDAAGRYLGATRAPYVAATHGDREADKANLGLLAAAAAEQRRRLGPVMAAQAARRREAVAANTAALLAALPATPDEAGQEALVELAAIGCEEEFFG